MGIRKEYILQLGKGKDKRQWSLSEEEFEEFEALFEECELIDLSDFGLDSPAFTLTISE